MRRLLTRLVLLGLIGFAAFKVGVWWLADQRLGDARTALESYGVLERGSISSGIDGRLVLSGSYWQDFRLTQPVAIGRVEFDVGSPVELLTVLTTPSQLPVDWSVRADNLGLILEAVMFRNWVTAAGDNGAGMAPLFSLSCAPDPRQQIGSGDLMRMGVASLTGEVLVRQSSEGVYAELSTDGTGSLELSWPGARLNLVAPGDILKSTDQALALTLRDGGLMRRIAAYCAREAGLETSAWARRSVDMLRNGLQERGLVATDQLLALYQQWLLEGGEITANLRPDAPAFGIPVYEAEGAVASGWTVTYNGANVPDVYLRAFAPAPRANPEAVRESAPTQENPLVEGWYAESTDSAGQWVGRQVRVTLSNSNVVEGRLVSVTDKELEVARPMAGGEVAYPMQSRAVVEFEVWRRGRTQ